MAFIQRGSMSPYPAGSQTLKVVIKNSEALTVGDLVTDTGDGADGVAATAAILGRVMGFYTAKGVPLYIAQNDADFVGTYSHTTDTYTASATNHDSGGFGAYALVDIDKGQILSGAPDATIGTTTGSDIAGGYTDLKDKDEVDENNAGNSMATAAQLYKLGLDPKDSSRGLYMIHEWVI